MTTPFLLTGVTGGLGAKILNDMLQIHHVSPSDIIATSRSSSNQQRYESQGLKFRIADYNRPETLTAAFRGVESLLFMSSSERDNARRDAEHANVVKAAKAAGVQRVWYVSLAFGGYGSESKASVQQSHYKTEELLMDSGLDFVTLRAGLYSDAFPLFLNWYPSSHEVLMPKLTPPITEGKVAWTSRDELGEGIATLLAKGTDAFPSISPRTERNILLLTGSSADSLVDLVHAINSGRRTDIPVRYLDPEDWIDASAKDDVGGKGCTWFELRCLWFQSIAEGQAQTVDPTLEQLLGRRPKTGPETVEALLKGERDYTWHQNHVTATSTW